MQRHWNSVEITAPARIHISLLNMSNAPYRKNGGIGFAITGFDTKIMAVKSNNLNISDNTPGNCICEYKIQEISKKLFQVFTNKKFDTACDISIKKVASQHTGFGSTTSLMMSCVEALFIINNSTYTPSEIVEYSGRGRTSGVGISTYFKGGLVLDAGSSEAEDYFPSSQSPDSARPSSELMSIPMPEWEIGVCLPSNMVGLSGMGEKEFFEKTCPLPLESAFKATYHALFGIVASAKFDSIEEFGNAINALQKGEWKAAEINTHDKLLKDIISQLKNLGATAIGMSSLGPLLYFLPNNLDIHEINLMESNLSVKVSVVNTQNTGRKVVCA